MDSKKNPPVGRKFIYARTTACWEERYYYWNWIELLAYFFS